MLLIILTSLLFSEYPNYDFQFLVKFHKVISIPILKMLILNQPNLCIFTLPCIIKTTLNESSRLCLKLLLNYSF